MAELMIVDDCDFDRRMIRMAIAAKRPDIRITEFSTGKAIVDAFSNAVPDVAILDIRMPGMDGFDVIQSIRSNPKFRDVTVLMVSGSEQPEDRRLADAAGANGYYVKPPSADAYLALGQSICETHLNFA